MGIDDFSDVSKPWIGNHARKLMLRQTKIRGQMQAPKLKFKCLRCWTPGSPASNVGRWDPQRLTPEARIIKDASQIFL